MGNLLALLILFLAFALKLSVNRSTTMSNIASSIIELPIDINFMCISFIISHIIQSPRNIESEMNCFVCALILSIITIIFWRLAETLFDQSKKFWVVVLTIINYSVSSSLFVYTTKYILTCTK